MFVNTQGISTFIKNLISIKINMLLYVSHP
jgi:hypothetical protein